MGLGFLPPMHFNSPSAFVRSFLALVSLSLGFLLLGCGGGGSTPADWAPASINARVITIRDPHITTITTTYNFAPATYGASPGGDSGSYTYAKIAGTSTQATLVLNSNFNSPPTSSYTLTFTSPSGGTYVDNNSYSSTFTLQ